MRIQDAPLLARPGAPRRARRTLRLQSPCGPQTRTRTAHINVESASSASARHARRRPYVASSGGEVTREAFQLWDVRNGKAIRCEMFDQEAEALAAVGRRSN
jgi:hypothetical protein